MRQVQEPVLIQAFVTQPPVERFDIGILVRLARLDQSKLYLMGMRPGQHGTSTELLAVVGTNHPRQASTDRKPVENPRECQATNGPFRHNRNRFVRGIIDDRQALDEGTQNTLSA